MSRDLDTTSYVKTSNDRIANGSALLPLPLFRFGHRYLQRHPWQTVLMVIGIMLGVAVVVAIDLANASASRAFDLSTDMVVGRATHQIIGGPTGIEEKLYSDLRRQGLEAPTAPVIVEYVSSPDLDGQPLQLLGVDPFAEAPFRNYLSSSNNSIPLVDQGLTDFFTKPGAILISTDLANRYGLAIGDTLGLNVAGQEQEVTIAGLLEPADTLSRRALEGILLVDVSTAQELSGRFGVLDRIDLILDGEDETLVDQIESQLSPEYQLVEVAARAGSLSQITAAFRTNLVALSLLALIVGLFLIYNTMTFSVVQRRPLFGTLRALGVTRGELFRMIISEALMAGIIGTSLGLLLGIILGQGAVRLVSQTINDLYFVVSVRGVAIPPSSLVKGGLLGVLATALAAAAPAWEAASVTPQLALSRSGLEDKASTVVSRVAIAGLILILGGAVVLFLPSQDLIVSFGGTFAIIVGAAMLTPQVTGLLLRGFAPLSGRFWGAIGRLAPRNVVKSLSRTSVAVAALMIAVSVTIGVSLMISSFRNTVEVWLTQTVQGDIYISPPAAAGSQNTGIIDPAVMTILASWPGVERIDTYRAVEVESADGPLTLAYTQNPNIGAERIYRSADREPAQIWPAMLDGAVLVSEPLANRLKLPAEGAAISLRTPDGLRDFPIAGTYYDYASSQGIVLMAHPTFVSIWGDDTIGAVSLRMAPGIDGEELALDLANALAPIQLLDVRANASLRTEALAVFDRTFAITSAMQLLTTLVAFIGVLSALLSLQLDKQKELGVLRSVGLSVRQLWRLVLYESGLLGASAGLLAIPTGFALAVILIYIINRRAFGWTLQLHLEPYPFIEAFAVAVIAALAAAVLPTWRMSKKVVAQAIRGE
ncbi:MAG: FtsX-like permease family protein [Chloroflexi bacterium]|nr:FtsX-like permease family protein [Chloroflexota bacterium]